MNVDTAPRDLGTSVSTDDATMTARKPSHRARRGRWNDSGLERSLPVTWAGPSHMRICRQAQRTGPAHWSAAQTVVVLILSGFPDRIGM
jgi:hypothetical protein